MNVNQHLPLLAAYTVCVSVCVCVCVCVCRCSYTHVEGSGCSLDVRTTNSVIKKTIEEGEKETKSGVMVVKDQRDNLDGGGKLKLNECDLCGRSCWYYCADLRFTIIQLGLLFFISCFPLSLSIIDRNRVEDDDAPEEKLENLN